MNLEKLYDSLLHKETVHMAKSKGTGLGTQQWFLEKRNVPGGHPITNRNALESFICGEKAFNAIYRDIQNATTSIDIVCWGFDPGMKLNGRSGAKWTKDGTYGELLLHKAREGKQVRLLIWHDALGSTKQNNMPGYTSEAFTPSQFHSDKWHYCVRWWREAGRGIPNLAIRLRSGKADKATASVGKYFPEAKGKLEQWLVDEQATHHQKPILIDYEAVGSENARPIAYVMGLNSTTDYWDTDKHLFNEPMRENHYGAPNAADLSKSSQPVLDNRKPLRDYAIRIEGEALHCVNRNFVSAWEQADAFSAGRLGQLAAHRAAIAAHQLVPKNPQHRCEIVRTQAEEDDASILETYLLATANAKNYLYLENQYFQLASWARFLKQQRKQFLDLARKAKAKPDDMSPLYLFVVIPQPEDDGMVPRTYDTVAELGEAERMDGYHQAVLDYRKAPRPADNKSALDQLAYPIKVIRREWRGDDIRGSADIAEPPMQKKELEAAGLQVLVAMLQTFDPDGVRKNPTNRYREIYIHSKLLLVDDVFTTLGSANLNIRSMAADSEININVADKGFTGDFRRRIWANLAGGDLSGGGGSKDEVADAHGKWKKRMEANKGKQPDALPFEKSSFIVPFSDTRGVPLARTA